jgi:hypothetical protein
MTKQEKRAYFEAIQVRYRRASKSRKTEILNEFCEVCGYHRKYALRLLNAPRYRRKRIARKSGPASRYNTPELLTALRSIWMASDQLCSKRLKEALPLWLPHYESALQTLPEGTYALLMSISAATIDRLLKPVRAEYKRKGLSGTKPGTLLKKQIPIQAGVWNVTQPGFMEADTVAHCGDSLAGDFVWSLTMTDICSGRTECRATWNKGAHGVIKQIKAIQKALPFTLKGFDSDNGTEFLNWHLVSYFKGSKQPIQFTRSRPYQSNDNAHVEQKNWSCVRQLFGYDRFADPRLVRLMNDLYANEFSLLTNFFYPTLKLKSKSRVGSRWVKKYSTPVTPAQRLIDHPDVPQATKDRLLAQAKTLDPFQLQKQIQRKLKAIFKLVR